MADLGFRTADLADVRRVLDWAAEEGWNPGLDDAAAFHAADPDGVFLAEVDGAPVAAISVIVHDPETAFLGLYLCRPEHRGRGHGLALWRHALAHAGDRAVGLDGVPAQQGNYALSGFVRTGETARLEGRLDPAEDPEIRPFRLSDLPAAEALDSAAVGHGRPAFLRAWLAETETRRTVVLDRGVGPEGCATARLCRRGAKVGPVLATDAATALRLIRAALAAVGADDAVVDVPDTAPALRRALEGQGLLSAFGTARMWRGTAPTQGPGLQAVATLELG